MKNVMCKIMVLIVLLGGSSSLYAKKGKNFRLPLVPHCEYGKQFKSKYTTKIKKETEERNKKDNKNTTKNLIKGKPFAMVTLDHIVVGDWSSFVQVNLEMKL